jgi:hypothetical protein
MTLASVDDWLNLKDWQFELHVDEGHHKNHYWLYSPELSTIDALSIVTMPEEFCVLATEYDGVGAGYMYSSQGWASIGKYVLSPPVSKLPHIYDGAQYAIMIVDKQKNRSEIEPLLAGFKDHYGDPAKNANFEAFQKAIETINPYLYISYCGDKRGEGLFLLMRGSKALEQFQATDEVKTVGDKSRAAMIEHRRALWRSLGPESGPETCNQPGCDRLRTPVSKKCFIHLNP